MKRLYLAWIPARGHTRHDALTHSAFDVEGAARQMAQMYYEDDRTLGDLVVAVAAVDGLAEAESGATAEVFTVAFFPEWILEIHSFDAEPATDSLHDPQPRTPR